VDLVAIFRRTYNRCISKVKDHHVKISTLHLYRTVCPIFPISCRCIMTRPSSVCHSMKSSQICESCENHMAHEMSKLAETRSELAKFASKNIGCRILVSPQLARSYDRGLITQVINSSSELAPMATARNRNAVILRELFRGEDAPISNHNESEQSDLLHTPRSWSQSLDRTFRQLPSRQRYWAFLLRFFSLNDQECRLAEEVYARLADLESMKSITVLCSRLFNPSSRLQSAKK
jgi:hypothetical protein